MRKGVEKVQRDWRCYNEGGGGLGEPRFPNIDMCYVC